MVIKRCALGALFGMLVLIVCSCSILNDILGEEEKDGEFDYTDVGKKESFWAVNTSTNAYYSINATLLAENDTCLVYAENNAAGQAVVENTLAEEIAREYVRHIEPQITGVFGKIAHITEKKKVTFLLLDIKDGYDPKTGGGYVAGYFDPEDMEGRIIQSNRRDMLYIDINPGHEDRETLYCTIAHELQHLINYSNTLLESGREPDLWINEGLSTAAEYIYGGDPANRIIHFNNDFGETIRFGNNFFVWYGFWELDSRYGDSLANYSTVYLFFQWLRLHADNGTGIYRDIINSPYTNYRAITETARARIPALGALGLNGSSTEKDWEILLRTWMLANFYQAPAGLYGYQDKIGEISRGKTNALSVYGFKETNKEKWEFYPGEGLFTAISDASYTPPPGSDPHIRYIALDDGPQIDTTEPYEGEVLLTFNANPDNTALYPSGSALLPGETGYLANTLDSAAGLLSGAARSVESPGTWVKPFSYPVDAGFMREKGKRESGRSPAAGK
jgi:hypothetical protein